MYMYSKYFLFEVNTILSSFFLCKFFRSSCFEVFSIEVNVYYLLLISYLPEVLLLLLIDILSIDQVWVQSKGQFGQFFTVIILEYYEQVDYFDYNSQTTMLVLKIVLFGSGDKNR